MRCPEVKGIKKLAESGMKADGESYSTLSCRRKSIGRKRKCTVGILLHLRQWRATTELVAGEIDQTGNHVHQERSGYKDQNRHCC